MTTYARAIAKGLAVREEHKAIGRQDAIRGVPMRYPDGVDMLDYALGYAEVASQALYLIGSRVPDPERTQ